MNSKYDDEQFFQEYAKMDRSQKGLQAAGEWHQLQLLFPGLEGKDVLDLGCGYGWHCEYAAKQKARKILGIDQSYQMISEARKKHTANNIDYRVCDLCSYEYPKDTWDLVVSNLVLHYVKDLEWVFEHVHQTLKPNGIFLLNIEHPVFTSGIHQDWIYDKQGKIQYWAIDDYFKPGERSTHFLGCEVKKQHHTLTQILMGLIHTGFELLVVEEAMPSMEMMELPGMKDELRRPMMLLVKAKAIKSTF